VDPGQVAQGRGAYVCAEEACLDRALRRGALARTLRTTIGGDEAERLRAGAVEYLREQRVHGLLRPASRPVGTPSDGVSPGEET
jgi:predicted RNA-binding protein YlxR (DUF448 family)